MRERARSDQDKAQRYEDILSAAESAVLDLGGVRFVTVAAVTDRVGLHRTGARRYFASKEQMLLQLAERGWGQWRDAVARATHGRSGLRPEELAAILVETITSLPVFCDLLAHAAMSLEDEAGVERARLYKMSATASHAAVVQHLKDASGMSDARVQTLAAATVALTASLWQAAHPGPALAQLYEQEPQWRHAVVDFGPQLTLMLQATALGLSELALD